MRIGINGTHPACLLEETKSANDALRLALDRMYHPNPRDWPGDEEGYWAAQKVLRDFVDAANAYRKFIGTVHEAAQAAIDARR